MITLNNINKYYNSGSEKYHALKDININFPDKGLVFIVGKSGSGKSTLLNIIGGIDSYDSGELIIDDLNTNNFTRRDFNSYRNSYVGFIFQEFNVIKNLTVFENVALALQLKKENVHDNHDLIMDTIKMVGLKGKEKRKMNQLSGGERQRVAIARALVKKPKMIIADEPTGNLDKNNRDTVMNILQDIAKEQLVIVVTHDKTLSSKYSSYEITLKDGEIISNTLENLKTNEDNSNLIVDEKLDDSTTNKENKLNPVQPSFKTSFILSFKSLKQNLLRFIFIILFFTISLIFASTTINLYFSDAISEYSRYQTEYNNKYITLSQTQTIYNHDIKTGFFQIDTINYQYLINSFNKKVPVSDEENSDAVKKNYNYRVYKTIKNSINININSKSDVNPLYFPAIDNILIIESLNDLFKDYQYVSIYNNISPRDIKVRCYITDYVAEALIAYDYFNDPLKENERLEDYFVDKCIVDDRFNYPIYFDGIIFTNFGSFKDADLSNPSVYTSFIDNLAFYNSLLITTGSYVSVKDEEKFVSTNNIKYAYEDFVFSALNNDGVLNDVKVTKFDYSLSVIKGKAPKHKPEDDDLEQVAVSTGLLKLISKYDIADLVINDNAKEGDLALLNPETGTPATFAFYGFKRILSKFSCQVVGIVEDDDPILYFCDPTESDMYYNYLKVSFSDYDNFSSFGGYLTVQIIDDEASNISLYRALRSNNIVIDNLSYIKLQVVNDFIDSNLILFLGLFFALLMFSILMIFNFVVITIKNTRKDIGIYMSLVMNGFKIACIYLIQIILVSIVAFILSTIGAIIFLKYLDTSLGTDASNIILSQYALELSPIDFDTFNITPLGILVSLVIAFIVPLVSVIIPLFNLSLKRPIDVLKAS